MANETLAQMEEELKADENTLLGKWRAKAYNQQADRQWLKRFWNDYFEIENSLIPG